MEIKWKGSYLFEQGEEKYPFEMTVSDNEGSFEGIVHDEEYRSVSQEPIRIKGFYDEDFMSFVIYYPFRHSFNAEGIVVIDNSKKGTATYEGNYNEENQKWEGDWEITVKEVASKHIPGNYDEEFLFGTWEMSEINRE